MADSKKQEEIVIGPYFGGGMSLYRRYAEGELVETGLGCDGYDPGIPGRCIHYGDVKENGRRDVKGDFTLNSPGSTCHSGGNSRAFVDGWEQTFGRRGKDARAN